MVRQILKRMMQRVQRPGLLSEQQNEGKQQRSKQARKIHIFHNVLINILYPESTLQYLNIFIKSPKVPHELADSSITNRCKLPSILLIGRGRIMEITSGHSNVQIAISVLPQTQSGNARGAENGSAYDVTDQPAPRPSINTSGQGVGYVIDDWA